MKPRKCGRWWSRPGLHNGSVVPSSTSCWTKLAFSTTPWRSLAPPRTASSWWFLRPTSGPRVGWPGGAPAASRCATDWPLFPLRPQSSAFTTQPDLSPTQRCTSQSLLQSLQVPIALCRASKSSTPSRSSMLTERLFPPRTARLCVRFKLRRHSAHQFYALLMPQAPMVPMTQHWWKQMGAARSSCRGVTTTARSRTRRISSGLERGLRQCRPGQCRPGQCRPRMCRPGLCRPGLFRDAARNSGRTRFRHPSIQ